MKFTDDQIEHLVRMLNKLLRVMLVVLLIGTYVVWNK